MGVLAQVTPADIVAWQAGWSPPDIIEFVRSDAFLNRPMLYPRQATFLKLWALQTELLTPYDEFVIEQWIKRFERSGDNGIQPDISDRIRVCRDEGRPWFWLTCLVGGRRGSKGYLGGIVGAYVTWTFMGKADPQRVYGIARDKAMASLTFAAKKQQARDEQWRDIYNVITRSTCFAPWISRPMTESLSLFAPHDLVAMWEMERRGVDPGADPATFHIEPRPSTATSGRGPASYCLDPATLVLTADLRWVPIGDIKEGDRLVAPDADPPGKGKQRKLRNAEVLKAWRTKKPALRITFEDGTEVVCSEDHQWMVLSWLKRDRVLPDGRVQQGGAYKWVPASRLHEGHHVRSIVDVWQPLVGEDRVKAAYLAGFFDGEGSVVVTDKSRASAIHFSQNPGPVLERVIAYLEELGFNPLPTNSAAYAAKRKEVVGPCEQWHLRGVPECLRFMAQVAPTRLVENAWAVWEDRALRGGVTPSGRSGRSPLKTIVSIESLPEQELVDITTETGAFLAEGLVSHNCLHFDEMAHLVAPGTTAAAQETFNQAEPSLGQFGTDGCIWAASSPWEMTGKFFELYTDALEREDGEPVYPHYLMAQMASWDLYEDYQLAGDLGLGEIERPIVSYDRDMKRLERANPQAFAVERRARFATVQDAYLDAKKVMAMFQPWPNSDREWVQQTKGRFNVHYFGHGDPAEVGKRFGFAIAHTEVDPSDPAIKHVVFDVVHAWDPADYPDHELPWLDIERELADFAEAFLPDSLTFDQAMPLRSIQFLKGELRRRNLPKRTEVYKPSSTAELDWRRWEALKLSLGMGWVHAPPGGASDIAELELRFLTSPRPGKVDHPTVGPVQTKDVADCIQRIVFALIGEQAEETKRMLSETPLVVTTSTSGPTERTETSPLSGFHARANRRGQGRMRRGRR